jgi:uncharacterized protein YjeT (DUF2065 family)
MSLDLLIARWVALLWLVCGLSHAVAPARWVALLWPLRERDTGGLILAAMSLPVGLVIVLGHNVWVLDVPVIITVAGWLTTIKSVAYLVFPRAHRSVMRSSERLTGGRPERGFRIIGVVMMVLGAVTAYDAFFRR